MSYYQGRDRRKPTGGIIHRYREKRKYELGAAPTETTLGADEDVKKISRSYGGNAKLRLDEVVYANVTDLKTNTTKKVKITKVKSNPSNVDYSRRGVITKGAIIETELGEAKVSSRPGQDGLLNAILTK
ncbi:MAG: 30S ribosomal protein S8e [Candidatus Methanosuratus sp.]|nr:30S ribosomal protein S8e [Candidatus Methanosuratincola sp.]